MAQVKLSKEIAAPREKVWEIIANPARFPEWLTVHTKFKGEPPTEISAGATFSEVATIMGMPNTIDWTVVEYLAPASLTISGIGMAGAKVTFGFSVEEQGDGCVTSIDAEFISQMMVGAIGAAVERASTKEVTQSLENLAGLVC